MTITDRLNQIAIATLARPVAGVLFVCLSFSAGVVSAQTPLAIEQARERMALLQQRNKEALDSLNAQEASRAARAMPSRAFNVVLLIGDLKNGTGMEDNIPAAARRALSDMKDFLPYKSYRFFDSTWVLHGDQSLGQTVNRIKGPTDENYSLMINSMTGRDKSSTSPKQMDIVIGLNQPTSMTQGKVHYDEIMQARTSMDIGETVVVGTSRLNGDIALILLVTAATEPTRVRDTPAVGK